MSKSKNQDQRDSAKTTKPREIPMTDLGWSPDGEEENRRNGPDTHAAGTPGGGTACGGLAGTNIADGDPENADLEEALGSGIADTSGDETGRTPYAGSTEGAVRGTPAEKRAKGGRIAH